MRFINTSLVLLSTVTALPVVAEESVFNPMFGSKQNQIMLHSGMSFRSNGFEKLFHASLSYSQPDTFFRLPARNNIEAGVIRGEDWEEGESTKYFKNELNLSQYDTTILGLSKDVAVLSGTNSYLTVGLGAYIKNQTSNRIGSKFTFGQRIGVGYRFDSGLNIELFARHFSNGSLTQENSGQNFAGLSTGFSF